MRTIAIVFATSWLALADIAGARAAQAPPSGASQSPDTQVLGWMSPAMATQVRTAALPVLVPKDQNVLQRARLIVEPRFYALSSKLEGATLSVHGTAVAHPAPAIPIQPKPASTVRGRPAFLSDNEGIKSITWTENGVSYVVDVECARADDQRCKSHEYVLAVSGSSTYVGGAVKPAPQR